MFSQLVQGSDRVNLTTKSLEFPLGFSDKVNLALETKRSMSPLKTTKNINRGAGGTVMFTPMKAAGRRKDESVIEVSPRQEEETENRL